MKSIDKKNSYDASCLQDNEGFAGIRKRPTMYIHSVDSKGLIKVALELIQNSIDEYTAGRCNHLKFEYDSKTKRMTLTDNGCGIPLEGLYKIVTKMHAGGKFDNEAYQFHAGSNGVGLTVCNALSSYFDIYSHRDGIYRAYHFKEGNHLEDQDEIDLKWKGNENVGVIVSLIPDSTIFVDEPLNKSKLKDLMSLLSYLNKGLTLDLIYDNEEITYYSERGLVDFLTDELKERKIKYSNSGIIEINGEEEDELNPGKKKFILDLVFTIASERNECLYSFVNNMQTVEHGKHVESFRAGLTQALNKYMRDHESIPKKLESLNISASIIRNYVSAIVNLKHKDPQYNGQVKEELSSIDMVPFIRNLVYIEFFNWLESNQKEAERIIDLIIKEAKAQDAAKKARDNVMGTKVKQELSEDFDISKFSPCKILDPEKSEIIIVEGDSAAGDTNLMRDANYQAVLRLKGKVTNMIKEMIDINGNESIRLLAKQLGCGFPPTDYSKLRYNKIIILTDADEDGAHIQVLLLGFFYKYYRPLIKEGRIFIAQPPLKTISCRSSKNKNEYHRLFILDNDYHDYYLKEFTKYKFDLMSDVTDKPLSKALFDLYISGLLEYGPLMTNRSKQILMDPNILEFAILYFHEIMKGNFEKFNLVGVDVKITESNNEYTDFDFDFKTNHYFMRVDKTWIETIYNPLIKILANKVKLNSVHFKNKNDKKIYKGTHYQYFKLIESFFSDGSNVKRFKGLGEMGPDLIFESVLNPETRRIMQVTLNDAEDAEETINLFLNKNKIEDRKNYFKDLQSSN